MLTWYQGTNWYSLAKTNQSMIVILKRPMSSGKWPQVLFVLPLKNQKKRKESIEKRQVRRSLAKTGRRVTIMILRRRWRKISYRIVWLPVEGTCWWWGAHHRVCLRRQQTIYRVVQIRRLLQFRPQLIQSSYCRQIKSQDTKATLTMAMVPFSIED